MCECVPDLFLFLSSLCPFPFVCCFSFVIQTSVYDCIYMNTVTMIVVCVCKCVCWISPNYINQRHWWYCSAHDSLYLCLTQVVRTKSCTKDTFSLCISFCPLCLASYSNTVSSSCSELCVMVQKHLWSDIKMYFLMLFENKSCIILLV